NICIYQTLAYVQPRIYRDELEKVVNKINTLTNNNFQCKFVISDLIISELKDDGILFWEIKNFCVTRLYKPYESLRIFGQAKKSIGKFILSYGIKEDLSENIQEYHLNLAAIDQFYLKFPVKLQNLTKLKISDMTPRQKQAKISQRPNDLPEETDRRLLGQAIEIKKIHHSDVYIFSNDGDFTEFSSEIPVEFNINILGIEDAVPSCATL
ncbi:MAG: hypothetical protein KKB21_01130, partial [Nanoarchaeota archaeon]|nr:hypothetical protein [Nanoarchaeota archaeon]